LVGLTVSLLLGGCGGAHSAVQPEGSGGAAAAAGGQGRAGQDAIGGAAGTAASAAGGGAVAAGGGAAAAGDAAGAASTAGSSPGSAGGGGMAALGGAAGTHSSAGGGSAGSVSAAGGASTAGVSGATDCPGLLCEDFEGGAIDPQKWQTLTKGGTAAIQMQTVAHGSYALHLHGLASGSDDWAMLVVKNVPPGLKGDTTYGRMNVYWGAEAAVSLHMQFPFAGRDGTGSATGPAPFSKLRYLEVGSYFGGWQLGMDLLDVSPSVEDVSHPNGKWPTNKWFCMEWEFEDQPDRVTLWLNGTQVGTLDSSNGGSNGALYQGKSNGIIGGFDTFGVGFHDWHPAKAFDVYYDDVVLDSKRIGCTTP